MSPPGDLDRLSYAELKGLVVKQWEQMVELQRTVATLREEIARLRQAVKIVGRRHDHNESDSRPPV